MWYMQWLNEMWYVKHFICCLYILQNQLLNLEIFKYLKIKVSWNTNEITLTVVGEKEREINTLYESIWNSVSCEKEWKFVSEITKAPQIQWRQSEIEHRIKRISPEQNNRLRNQGHGVRRKIKSGTPDICRCSQLVETGQHALSLSSSFSFRLRPKRRERFTDLPQQSLSVLQSQNAALSHYVFDRCGCGREDNSLVLPVFTDSHSQPKSTALPATEITMI